MSSNSLKSFHKNIMYKNLLKLDQSNNLKFSTKFSFLTLLFSLIPLLCIKLTSGYSSAMNFIMFANLISISYAFYLFRYKSGIILSWIGYIKIGSLISFFTSVILYFTSYIIQDRWFRGYRFLNFNYAIYWYYFFYNSWYIF